MQLEVILYLLGRLSNIPTNWYWYFNICFCSNAQFLTPRETLDWRRLEKSAELRSDHSILKRGMEVSSGLGYSNVG